MKPWKKLYRKLFFYEDRVIHSLPAQANHALPEKAMKRPPTKFGPVGPVQRQAATASPPRHAPPPTKFGPSPSAQAKAASAPHRAGQPPPPTKFSPGMRGQSVAQRKLTFNSGTEYLDDPGINIPGYKVTLDEARRIPQNISVVSRSVDGATALYSPTPGELSGQISVAPLEQSDIDGKTKTYYERLVSMAHETRHGIDDLTKKVRFRDDFTNRIRSEWRAFATHAATAAGIDKSKVPDRFTADIPAFQSTEAFMSESNSMVGTTASYLRAYGIMPSPSTGDVLEFMRKHADWVEEAVLLHKALSAGQDQERWLSALKSVGWTSGAISWEKLIEAFAIYQYGK